LNVAAKEQRKKMSKTAKTKIVDPKDAEIWAACGSCGKETAHKILAKIARFDESPCGDIQVWNDYHIIQCQGCKIVSFCEESSCSEDVGFDEEGKPEFIVTQRLYPGRVVGRPLLEEFYNLPHGVAQIYKQTHEALCGKLSILAGVGLRIIVEAVCSERKASGRDLKERINNLVKQGVVTNDGADILHSIRLLGNKAAHETQANTQDELYAAFEVVEHLLKAVYIIPRKAQKLKKAKS
jgi:hypothetical protein